MLQQNCGTGSAVGHLLTTITSLSLCPTLRRLLNLRKQFQGIAFGLSSWAPLGTVPLSKRTSEQRSLLYNL